MAEGRWSNLSGSCDHKGMKWGEKVKERGKEGYFFEFGPGFGCGVYSVWGCLVRLRVIVARGVNSFFNTEDPSRFAMIHTCLLLGIAQ